MPEPVREPTLLLALPLLVGLGGPAPAGAGQAGVSAAKPSAAEGFEEAARRAALAREAGDVDEAIRGYRRGTALRPTWDEGWWYVGALSYESRRPAEAAEAFRRFVALKPDSGPGWAMRGLAEFDAARYDAAIAHLAKALRLGSVGNLEIRDSVYHHLAVLRIRRGQFELAVEPLTTLAQTKPETPSLVTACGLLLVREARLPAEVPAGRRALVEAAGRAAYAAMAGKPEARERFEDAIRRFPREPGLHYGYGGWLRQLGADHSPAAIEQFRREIEVDPRAVYPRLEIAFEFMKQGEHRSAVPYAEEAARLAPALFAPHFALGRALVETGQLERGIAAFEEAVRLAPDVAETRTALARAYVQAGRRADAERERLAVQKLQARREASGVPAFAREETVKETPAP
jgi:tetratricopeptide (TPR) repeat protein